MIPRGKWLGYSPAGGAHRRSRKHLRGLQMEISQRRNANRIRFTFGEASLQYQQQDGSGSRSFSVDYVDISRDRQTLVERNDWLRNVGLLWLAIGAVMTAINWIGGNWGMPNFWIFIGAGCYAFYHFRSTPFTILPTPKATCW